MKKKKELEKTESAPGIICTGYNCNNNCIYCGIPTEKRSWVKTKEEIMGKILKAKREGVGKIVFTGGEPTVHKDFLGLLDFAKKQGFQEIVVTTNGRAFSDNAFAKKVAGLGVEKFRFNIVSHDPKVHDFLMRAEGSFLETVEGAKNLSELGVKLEGNLLVLKQNYNSLCKTIEFFKQLGFSKIYISFPEFRGNAKKNKKQIEVSLEDAAPFVLKCLANKKPGLELELTGTLPCPKQELKP